MKKVYIGFQIVKRAVATILEEKQNQVKAIHNGYGKILNERHFHVTDQKNKIKGII